MESEGVSDGCPRDAMGLMSSRGYEASHYGVCREQIEVVERVTAQMLRRPRGSSAMHQAVRQQLAAFDNTPGSQHALNLLKSVLKEVHGFMLVTKGLWHTGPLSLHQGTVRHLTRHLRDYLYTAVYTLLESIGIVCAIMLDAARMIAFLVDFGGEAVVRFSGAAILQPSASGCSCGGLRN